MAKLKLSGKDLRAIGYPESPVISLAMDVTEKNYKRTFTPKIVKMDDTPLRQRKKTTKVLGE